MNHYDAVQYFFDDVIRDNIDLKDHYKNLHDFFITDTLSKRRDLLKNTYELTNRSYPNE